MKENQQQHHGKHEDAMAMAHKQGGTNVISQQAPTQAGASQDDQEQSWQSSSCLPQQDGSPGTPCNNMWISGQENRLESLDGP